MRTYSLKEITDVLGIVAGDPEVVSTKFNLPPKIKKGERHDILWRFLRSQKARGTTLGVALAGCHALNEENEDPLDRATLDAHLRRVWNQDDSPAFKARQERIKDFILTAKGDGIHPKNQDNVRLALEKLGVGLSFNCFSQRPLINYNGNSGTYQDEARNHIWLEIDKQFSFQVPDQYFDVVVSDITQQAKFHPVCDYLAGLSWDGVPRLDNWLIAYAKAADSDYVKAISSIVLIAAVRRVRRPGVKFDEMLVLESGQGLLKSSALRALCKNEDWFGDDLPLNVDAKQLIERTSGKWIIEAPELSGMHISKVEHLKAMLSRQIDGPVRMAYARLPVEQPRQFIIIGSTNAHQYLDDSTGNRRFWPVRVEGFDVEGIRRDRDQLWAEAARRETIGGQEIIRLDRGLWDHAMMQQERRRTDDPWEHILSNRFEKDFQRLTPGDIWQTLGVPIERQNIKDQKRITQILQRLGFKRSSVRDADQDMKVVKGWARGTQNDGFIQENLPES